MRTIFRLDTGLELHQVGNNPDQLVYRAVYRWGDVIICWIFVLFGGFLIVFPPLMLTTPFPHGSGYKVVEAPGLIMFSAWGLFFLSPLFYGTTMLRFDKAKARLTVKRGFLRIWFGTYALNQFEAVEISRLYSLLPRREGGHEAYFLPSLCCGGNRVRLARLKYEDEALELAEQIGQFLELPVVHPETVTPKDKAWNRRERTIGILVMALGALLICGATFDSLVIGGLWFAIGAWFTYSHRGGVKP